MDKKLITHAQKVTWPVSSKIYDVHRYTPGRTPTTTFDTEIVQMRRVQVRDR